MVLCKILGYFVEELIGKIWVELIYLDDVLDNEVLFDVVIRG